MITPHQNLYFPHLLLLLSMVFCCNSIVILCENLLPQTLTMFVAVETLTFIFLATVHYLKMKGSYPDLFWDNLFHISMYLITINDATAMSLSTGFRTLFLGSVALVLHMIMGVIKWRFGRRDLGQEEEEIKRVPWLLKIGFVLIGNSVAIMGRFLVIGDGKNIASIFMFAVSALLFKNYYCLCFAQDTQSNTHLLQ